MFPFPRNPPAAEMVTELLIICTVFCPIFDLGFSKLLRRCKLSAPWSQNKYNQLEYSEARLNLAHDFEREYLLTREQSFKEIEEGIRKSTKFSNLQKKALLTRLGIQKNHMLHEEILASKTKSQENKSQPTAST